MGYDARARAAAVKDDPAAAAVIERYAPGVLDSPVLSSLTTIRLGALVGGGLFVGEKPRGLDQMWAELADLDGSDPEPEPQPAPGPPADGYEGEEVPRASARIETPQEARVHERVELVLHGPDHGNPFIDVELTAHLTLGDRQVRVGGFYDGGGIYRLRWLPDLEGQWHLRTSSNARSLDGVELDLEVVAAPVGIRGPVRVADDFHFAHADGTRFHPFGTTLYAWWHQPEDVRRRTLASLARTSFTKARVCVFPKSFLFNREEPEVMPYVRSEDGTWDLATFDPEFFRRLERGVEQLAAVGVQTDLILFHAYDRWGFSEMPAWADEHYVRYVVRRLAAHESVWWSLANEYDLVRAKTTEDWERIAQVIGEEDHADHLTSIHNCYEHYDHTRPWITHASVQLVDAYRTAEDTDDMRERWGKPVVFDECGYEGDLEHGWGNITGQELVRRAWEGALRGGYVNHGETYLNETEELWWSKGGELVGSSPERFAFLRSVIAELPGGRLDPVTSNWDAPWAAAGDVLVTYLGFAQPRYRTIIRPPGTRYTVDIIDTWAMTVERLPREFEGAFRVELPGRQWIALRLTPIP